MASETSVDPIWSELFDEAFYLDRYPEARAVPGGGPAHFRAFGWERELCPHPLFSTAWYRRQILGEPPEADPLTHYINYGAAAGLDPHPLFLTKWYRDRADGVDAFATPVHHYLATGGATRISSHWLFDASLYCTLYPDVTDTGINPLLHYLVNGEMEGRMASPVFVALHYSAQQRPPLRPGDALTHFAALAPFTRAARASLFARDWYLSELAARGIVTDDPLRHFLTEGCDAGLSPHPLFDADYYRRSNPDLTGDALSAFRHFTMYGCREGRNPHALFATNYYVARNPDLGEEWPHPWAHYVLVGGAELRSPHPMFDPVHYVRMHPEAHHPNGHPLLDYLSRGPAERRHPHPLFDRLHQAVTSTAAIGAEPLCDYAETRANLPRSVLAGVDLRWDRPARTFQASVSPVAQDMAQAAPLVSIIVPTYESEPVLLRACLDSVRAQDYENWEVICVDDGSRSTAPAEIAREFAAKDVRFTAIRLADNGGISAATNRGLDAASGEFVAFVDHDDMLAPEALTAMIAALSQADADAAYSDQSYITVDGRFDGDFHKPGWSPALLAGVMYIGHLLIVRRSVAIAAGGFDTRFDRLQDYEFMLRVSEASQRIVHVPQLLYGWRRVPGSIAHNAEGKGKLEPLQAAACQAHLDRSGIRAEAVPIEAVHHRLRLKPRASAPPEVVHLVILDGIGPQRPYPSDIADKFHTVSRVSRDDPAGLNELIREATAPYVVLWDPRVEPYGDWLAHILIHLTQDDVIAAAPHLVGTDGTMVAVGLVADPTHGLLPAMAGLKRGADGYAGALICDREVSALPAYLIGVKRDLTLRLNGLNEDFRSVACAIADLSYRATRNGYRAIAVAEPPARIDGRLDVLGDASFADNLVFRHRHQLSLSEGDRFYNRNFRQGAGEFRT